MDFAYDFVFNDPSYFIIFVKGVFLQISSGLELMLGFFVLPISVCLNSLEMISPSLVCLNYLEIIVGFTDFCVLDLFWDRQNFPFL